MFAFVFDVEPKIHAPRIGVPDGRVHPLNKAGTTTHPILGHLGGFFNQLLYTVLHIEGIGEIAKLAGEPFKDIRRHYWLGRQIIITIFGKQVIKETHLLVLQYRRGPLPAQRHCLQW